MHTSLDNRVFSKTVVADHKRKTEGEGRGWQGWRERKMLLAGDGGEIISRIYIKGFLGLFME